MAEISCGEGLGLERFIVDTRPLPGSELDVLGQDVPGYELQPFGRDDLPRVAGSWFRCLKVPDPEGTTRRFLRALEQTRLTALAHVPLMTAMLCQLHAAAPQQPLPVGRGQLYRDFSELLHRHQHLVGAPDALSRTAAGLPPYRAGALTAAEEVLGQLPALAGEALVGLDRREAAEVFHLLASERARFPVMSPFAQSVRVDAAWRLSKLGDPRASALLLSLSRDPSVGPFPRVSAASLLATLGESSAADQLHMLTRTSEINAVARLSAAIALLGLGDQRAAPVIHLLAVLPEIPDHLKIQAARDLVELGDPQAAELLRTLHALVDSGPFDGHRQCILQLLAQLGDPHAIKLVRHVRTHELNRAQRILRLLVFHEPYRVPANRGQAGRPAADGSGSAYSDHG
ncbi:hypothetical protein OG523_01105 [Streptomyces virginiae]|uniref:HEAT repeat domain-containing protein n=1 Tax=Streptomyces virginiae TaxID=1961 RepID=UPI002E323B5A|nr:hypothetical protein [Streptomyces virginiae]